MVEHYDLGLIGYPLEHSLSPQLHHAAIEAMRQSGVGITGEYKLYPIPPFTAGMEALSVLLMRVRQGELQGLNVTIPHKQNVIAYLDELSPVAQAIGAVNTIYLREGRLFGDNTDIPGFLADLGEMYPLEQYLATEVLPHALILGAGGSARAVAYALHSIGMEVTIAARRVEQSESLVDSFYSVLPDIPMHATRIGRDTIEALNQELKLIVNTTPVGMWPNINDSPWPARTPFPSAASLYDLVYNPPATKLVRQARKEKLKTRTGLGMLVEQAALALEKWTGCSVPRLAMWAGVPDYLLPDSAEE